MSSVGGGPGLNRVRGPPCGGRASRCLEWHIFHLCAGQAGGPPFCVDATLIPGSRKHRKAGEAGWRAAPASRQPGATRPAPLPSTAAEGGLIPGVRSRARAAPRGRRLRVFSKPAPSCPARNNIYKARLANKPAFFSSFSGLVSQALPEPTPGPAPTSVFKEPMCRRAVPAFPLVVTECSACLEPRCCGLDKLQAPCEGDRSQGCPVST